MKLWLATLFAAFIATGTASAATIMDEFNSYGDTATVSTRGGAGVPCYFDQKHMLAAENAAAINDDYGLSDATNGHAVTLSAGQRVMMIDSASNWHGGAVRLRLLSGSDAGTACWVPGYLDDVVKDVRHQP